MHAIIIQPDQSLAWQHVPDPQPLPDHVVIDIHAAALNRADLLQRKGLYPPPPGWPQWMGLEVAGVISHTPQSSRWRIGDRVCALLGGGGYAQKVAVPQNMVLPIPENLSFTEAAAIPEAFVTSYLNLCIEAAMQPGETVFIQAGASGLGMAAIQLARALGAGKIITTVGSDEKAAFVKQLGADIIIHHKQQNVADALAQHPVDVAMDCVAGPQLGPCLQTLAQGGRWVIIATLAGSDTHINANDFFRRGVKLIGSTLRSRSPETKAKLLSELHQKIWPAFSSGKIKPIIHKTLPIQHAEEAHAILRNNENLGKVVLTIN